MKNNYFIQKAFLLILVLAGTGWVFKANSQSGGWEERAPLSSERGSMGTCVIDNDIYLFGGFDASVSTVATAEKYNVETGITTPLANMGIPLGLPSVNVINKKIYLVGGFKDNSTISNLVQEYDPTEDNWTLKKEFQLLIGHHTTCVMNNKLYVFGGRFNEGAIREFRAFVYDPVADRWDSIAPMHNNQERCQASSCVYDGNMYVFGGHELLNPNIYTNTAEKYDPVADEWTVLENMPVACGAQESIVRDGKIYLFGGETQSHYGTFTYQPINDIWEYDPEGDSWKRMKDMPIKRLSTVGNGQQVGQYLYLLGGPTDTTSYTPVQAEVWRFNLDSLQEDTTWSSTSSERHLRHVNNNISLRQNRPNPFSGTTTISYELKMPGEVELFIYDILGKKVALLVNEFQASGNYESLWDVEGVKPGVYFCELRVADCRQIMKMIVQP
jgi:N-acetylneuraminic acid mutarotase